MGWTMSLSKKMGEGLLPASWLETAPEVEDISEEGVEALEDGAEDAAEGVNPD